MVWMLGLNEVLLAGESSLITTLGLSGMASSMIDSEVMLYCWTLFEKSFRTLISNCRKEISSCYEQVSSHGICLLTQSCADRLYRRSGFVEAYSRLDKEAKVNQSSSHAFPGLAQSKEVAKWLWEQQFAGVAGDNPAFECVRMCSPIHFDNFDRLMRCSSRGCGIWDASSNPFVGLGHHDRRTI
jgi:hypothetical protein